MDDSEKMANDFDLKPFHEEKQFKKLLESNKEEPAEIKTIITSFPSIPSRNITNTLCFTVNPMLTDYSVDECAEQETIMNRRNLQEEVLR